jgi:hypothetical protein
MYTQTNVGLLCYVGSGSNVAVALDGAATGIGIRITQALNALYDRDITHSTEVRTVRSCHVNEHGNSKIILNGLS